MKNHTLIYNSGVNYMNLSGNENNTIILLELGKRIKNMRISMDLKQAELAEKSGVSLKTLSRIESGENVSIENFLNALRALDLIQNLNLLIPDQEFIPTELIKSKNQRKRVSRKKKETEARRWKWGDEE